MNTTNKHIGNQLYQMKDRDIKEVFEQFAHKSKFDPMQWEQQMLNYLKEILLCEHFDYNGWIDLGVEEYSNNEI